MKSVFKHIHLGIIFQMTYLVLWIEFKRWEFEKIEGGSGKIPAELYRKMCEDRGISIPSTGASFNDFQGTAMYKIWWW